MGAGQGLRKHLQGRMPVVRSAGPGVEAVGDAVELLLAEHTEVGALVARRALVDPLLPVSDFAAIDWSTLELDL